jgi:hypothetical protein
VEYTETTITNWGGIAMNDAPPFPYIPHSDELLIQARMNVYHAVSAIAEGDWLKADAFLKLAIDQIADSGILS